MKSFSWSYKLLHWLMAVLICLMFFALQGFSPDMNDAERTMMLVGHSSIGTIISILLLVRISKRFLFKHQMPERKSPKLQAFASKMTHYALYLLMFLVPLTGYMTANFHQLPVQLFGSLSLNGQANTDAFSSLRLIHATGVRLLIGLVVLHVAAALIHKFILKDKVLSAMRPWFARKES